MGFLGRPVGLSISGQCFQLQLSVTEGGRVRFWIWCHDRARSLCALGDVIEARSCCNTEDSTKMAIPYRSYRTIQMLRGGGSRFALPQANMEAPRRPLWSQVFPSPGSFHVSLGEGRCASSCLRKIPRCGRPSAARALRRRARHRYTFRRAPELSPDPRWH